MTYLHRGSTQTVCGDLPTQLWASPQNIEEHYREVAIEAGAHVAAALRSWFPPVEVDFIKDGVHPDISEDRWQELLDSSIDLVTGLLSDLNVNPGRFPLEADAPRPPPAIGDIIDEDVSDLEASDPDDSAPPA